MIPGQGHDDRFIEQQARFNILRSKGQFAHKGDIGLCAKQRLGLAGGGHFLDHQLDLGEGFTKLPQCIEQRFVIRDGHCRDCEHASNPIRHLAGVFHPLFQLLERSIGRLQKGSAGSRQFDLALVTAEQAEAQLVFQAVNGLAQGRLGHVQAQCRAMKVQLFSHRNELPEQPGFDHFQYSFN